jgi:hypothetical protein
VSSLRQAAQAPRVCSDVPNTKAATQVPRVRWGCPAHRHQPQRHLSPRGFSSTVITIFLKFINDDDNNNNNNNSNFLFYLSNQIYCCFSILRIIFFLI